MNLRKIIKEELEDFDWAREIVPKWEPKVGDKFICKPGFNKKIWSDYYGGAAYEVGRVYTIERITPDLDNDDYTILWGEEDENSNGVYKGVYKRATEPYFGYLSESEEDDFDWARGEVIFTINDIIGKKCTYRENNLSKLELEYDVSMFDLSRGDLKLGPIRYDESFFWWVTGLKGNKVVITLIGGTKISDYTIEEVEQYVNLGIWVLFDSDGNILNDFSK